MCAIAAIAMLQAMPGIRMLTLFQKNCYSFSLLPDGRIFGQITQKRPQKIIHGRKKLEAVKWQNLAKSGRKEAGKYFFKY
jgi:hypothetical protein